MKRKQANTPQPSLKTKGKSPSDRQQAVRSAGNKLRAIRKDAQAKAKAINRKFAKGVCKGHTRQERKLDAALRMHLLHVAREYEAHRHNPTAVIPTAQDLHTARVLMLWQRQQEIRQQDEQRRQRLEVKRARMNGQG